MSVVHDDLPSGDVEQIETTRRLREVGRELVQRIADAFELHVASNGDGRGGESVGDVGTDATTQSGRDFRCQEQARLVFVLEQCQHLARACLAQHDCPASFTPVIADDRILLIHREEDDFSTRRLRHADGPFVIRVEHARSVPEDRLRDDGFDPHELFQRRNATQAEVVAADIGDDGDVAAVEAETGANDATARRLQHGEVDGRVLQHHLRARGPGHIAGGDLRVVDIDAIGHRYPDVLPRGAHDVRDHAGGRGLAIGASNGDDRDAGRSSVRKEHVDHGASHAAGMPLSGMGVHAEAGTGVDLNDPTTGLAHGAGDVGGDHVHSGDVEPDDHRRLPRDLGVDRVYLIGTVDRGAPGAHVAGLLEPYVLARVGDGVDHESLPGKGLQRPLIDGDAGQHFFVPNAAPGIGIGDIDQFADGQYAVAHYMSRNPLRHRDHTFVDDENAIVLPGEVSLDHDPPVPTFTRGGSEVGAHLRFVPEVEADATAMIPVEWLQHDRVADPRRGRDGLFDAAGDLAAWRGNADALQQAVCQILVAGDGVGDVGRHRGDRRPDPLLVAAVTELNERATGMKTEDRDAATLRRDDRRSRG